MDNKELRKYQLSQLELLDKADEICRTLNLTYYLIGGTLLGAVRHKGFIPWDVDIDIGMPRKDYEAFLRYWENNPDDRYFYEHYTTDKYHLSPHATLKIKNSRVIFRERISKYSPRYDGIYMDVFPLDVSPETVSEQKRQAYQIIRLQRLVAMKAGFVYTQTSQLKKIVKQIVQWLLLPVSFVCLNKMLDRCMKRYSDSGGDHLVSMASQYSYQKQRMPAKIYGTPAQVEFEGKMYYAPQNADAYLTRIYGDYMTLPPEESRGNMMDGITEVVYAPKIN